MADIDDIIDEYIPTVDDSKKKEEAAQSQPTPVHPETKQRLHGDKHIWGTFILLCIVSIIELYSASSREVASAGVYGPIIRHCALLCIGVAIVWTLEKVPYKWFVPLTPFFVFVSMGMMVYVMFFGEIVNGARRSLTIVGLTLQPAEFIKMSAVLVIALIMSRTQERQGVTTKGVAWSAGIVLLFGALLFNQGLTNTILLMAISLSMMLIGGVQWKKFGVVLIVYGVIAAGGLVLKDGLEDDDIKTEDVELAESMEDDMKEVNRFGTWTGRLDRFWGDTIPKYAQPINALNRQEMYSYMAQANGGIFGVFPGNSRETARLPLAFSDYIFAIIVEDLGFVGGLLLMLVYLWLLRRAGGIASRCSRAFPALLVMGMAVMIVFQALFHMAITTGAFPVSGQPLPLISKGGTSIIVTSIAFGIMLSVSRYAVQNGKKNEIKAELNALPESVKADNPTQLS